MGATASLPTAALAVEPGSTAELVLRVRNSGDVVDEFTFEVVGAAAAWTTVVPASVSLFPDADDDVLVVFAPPRSPTVHAGEVPFAVRVVSREDPDGSVAEEGTVEVRPFAEVDADLVPRTSEGRLRGRHEVRVRNAGNATSRFSLTAADPDAKLAFAVEPPAVVVPPGGTGRAVVRPSAPHRFLNGPPRAHPLAVTLEAEDGEVVLLDGVFAQRAVLPRRLLRLLGYALVAALALFLLWRAVLRPTLESAARDAMAEQRADVDRAAQQVAEAAAAVEASAVDPQAAAAAAAAAAQASEAAASLSGDAAGGAAGGTEAPSSEPGADGAADAAAGGSAAGTGPAAGSPTDFRLARSVPAGESQSATFVVPQEQALSLTDLVLQNPQGDRGVMQIKRGEGAVLIETRMENFRDLDYHFVSGIPYAAGEAVVLTIICENDAPTPCNGAAYFAGFLRPAPAAEPTAG